MRRSLALRREELTELATAELESIVAGSALTCLTQFFCPTVDCTGCHIC